MATLTTARSPSAFLLSALLHALIVVGVLVFAWWAQRRQEERPQIFELVAGEGSDYAATEAPTTAVPDLPTVKLELPEPPPVVTPAPAPQPPPPRIEPAPQPAPPPPPKREPPPPAPKQTLKIEKAPEPKPEQPRTTFSDYVKQHGAPKPQPQKAPPKISPKTIDGDSIARRVPSTTTNSATQGAGGTALTRPEADLWQAYISLIIQRIRRSMESAGVTDLRSARVEFRVSVDGRVSGARIIASSGSSEFDAAVLAAFRSIGLLGPPPTGRAEALAVTIEMRERG